MPARRVLSVFADGRVLERMPDGALVPYRPLPVHSTVAYFRDGERIESRAKPSVDNGATVRGERTVPADSVSGDGSRPSRGGGTPATYSAFGPSLLGESAGSNNGNGGPITRPAPGGVEALTPHHVSRSGAHELAGGSADPLGKGAEASASPSLGVSSRNLPAAGGSHPAQTLPPALSGWPDRPAFLDRGEPGAHVARLLALPSEMREGAQVA